jgi:hypothetical protein
MKMTLPRTTDWGSTLKLVSRSIRNRSMGCCVRVRNSS